MSDINALIRDEETKNTTYQDEITRLKTAQNNSGKDGSEDDTSAKKMPRKPDEASLIAGVQNLADDTASTLNDLRFETRTQQSSYLEMPFTFTVVTNYYSLVSFLQGIGESERFIQVTGLNIVTDPEHSVLTVTVNALAFSYTGPAEVNQNG